jgi:outer membrane receptor protein involved in Fe transport
VLGDIAVTPRVRALAGARLEAGRQRVATYDMFAVDAAPVIGGQSALHVLPAFTLSCALADEAQPDAMVLRLGYGRTVSRPELRELSEVPYYDYRSGRLFQGNPALVDATIDHVDVRWEWYPADGESLSAALFHKSFTDPIESVVAVSAVSGSVGTFENVAAATNLGGELDARKRLDVVHPSLYDLYVSGNVAVIWSRVDLRGADGNQTSDRRPLQGQSPYVANVQLGYDNPDGRTNVALLYNVSGPRILEVGTGGVPDTYELPVHRVDLVVNQGLGARWQLRARAQNLLDWPVRRQVGETISAEMREGWRATLGITYVTGGS